VSDTPKSPPPANLPPLPDREAVEAAVGPYRAATDRAASDESYRALLGFVPPRIQSRVLVQGALDPRGYDLTEELRAHLMYPPCFDTKTAQLMLFGMLLTQLSDAAQLHAIGARNAGATWEELNAVVGLCFLFRGLSAANRGSEIVATMMRREYEASQNGSSPAPPGH
jgi:alkylhydroperoxidase/carboxymuconolactone decarboxylase family protein YurZ